MLNLGAETELPAQCWCRQLVVAMRQFERSLIAVACIRGWLHSLPERRFYAAGSANAAPLSLLQEGLGKR
jgi:hypothetical protein